jgi:hypothetical protein
VRQELNYEAQINFKLSISTGFPLGRAEFGDMSVIDL